MKKIFLVFILLLLISPNAFASKHQIGAEIFNFSEQVLSKIYFAGKNFELIKNDISIYDHEELKINYFPEILKKIDRNQALNYIENDKLQIYGQFDFCGPMDFEKKDEICVYDQESYFSQKTYFSPNRNFSELYKVYSEENEVIDFEYYPISPDFFPYYRYYSKTPPFLTVFTNNLDIFEPKIYIYQNYIGFNIYKNNFEKKYKLVKMSYGNYIYIPYYSVKLALKKGDNFFKFNYKKL